MNAITSLAIRHFCLQNRTAIGSHAALAFLCVLASFLPLAASAQSAATPLPSLSAEQIVQQMTERNRERAEALRNYSGNRVYHVRYTGFPGKREAVMTVRAQYTAPNQKEFTIVSQNGSSLLINRVLKKLLESEQEAATKDNAKSTALGPQNYQFELLGTEAVNDRPCYLLGVIPKQKSKFLYRGKVWVDGSDFAVVKIEAEPAKRPSFWISKTRINHSYAKVGDFWLPAENLSTTDVRLGGVATLTIKYADYVVNAPEKPAPAPASEASRLGGVPAAKP
ncbi:MAG: outer membrane lipoprotein-sorting protein [Terriglobales bacterium]